MNTNENILLLNEWLALTGLPAELRAELEGLLADYEAQGEGGAAAADIGDRFYRDLEFGTAGMRGIMGAGRNRMNVLTVRRASQGFASVLLDEPREWLASAPSIVIAYDNRRDSDLFAYEAACVFVANGIKTWLFPRLSATPLLSYAVRRLGADAGVVVTASHNGRKYNGYKIYDRTGCQCRTEAAGRVAARIADTALEDGIKSVAGSYAGSLAERVAAAAQEPLLEIISDALEEEYVERVLDFRTAAEGLDKLGIVYTPLNGAGSVPVKRLLTRLGVNNVAVVPEQDYPDPEFTSCPEPNPEKPDAFRLGLELARKKQAEGKAPDLLLGTDPDCDRVGVSVFDGDVYVQLNGNQTGVLMLDYLIEKRRMRDWQREGAADCGLQEAEGATGRPLTESVMVTTIVSTPLASVIAEANGLRTVKVLTGFKYIGELMNELEAAGEEDRFLLGFEESCGYLSGTHARDKDAVNAVMIICEMAAEYKRRGATLLTRLNEVEEKHGYFAERLAEFARPGEQGMSEIAAAMAKVRKYGAAQVDTIAVAGVDGERPAGTRGNSQKSAAAEAEEKRPALRLMRMTDYAPGVNGLPPAEVVQYDTEGGGRVIFRPSGTEPKLKVYISARGETREAAELEAELLFETFERLISTHTGI
jgi:phosphoglucomutase